MSNLEAAELEIDAECPALFEAANPKVYRRNAFRVSGLPVEATPRDISRHAEKLRILQRYNVGDNGKTPLAIDPPPDQYAVREALHKLQDPEKRLIDEFFWFWPHQLGQSQSDEALNLLSQGDIDLAAKRWLQMEQYSESHVSMHNLAVLYHCRALDWEQTATNKKPAEIHNHTILDYWSHAFKRWKAVLKHEPFWSRLSARIRALEDPRLTTGLARRMRSSLPISLLSINASLAVRYAEAGDMEAAQRQLEIMKLWEASSDGKRTLESKKDTGAEPSPSATAALGPFAHKAIKDAISPIRQRITSICKNAENQTDSEPIQGYKAASELINHTGSLLSILDSLLPQGDATREAAHDDVALCVLRCQIPYGNKTKNWKVSLQLLELAHPIAVGKIAHDRIQENIDIIKGNLEYEICWFCKENQRDAAADLEVKMFGDVTRNGNQIRWRHGSVKVPRCTRCRNVHTAEWKAVAGLFLGVIIGAILMAPKAWVAGALIGAAIGFAIGKVIDITTRPTGVNPVSEKSEFPSIKELMRFGWKFGEKPNTQ